MPGDPNSEKLPMGWKWVRLGDLSEIVYGYTASANPDAPGPKYLRITDIKDGTVDWSQVPSCEINQSDEAKKELRHGDIVVARTGSTGKSLLVRQPPRAVLASYLLRIRVNDSVFPEYLAYFFNSARYWSHIADSSRGSVQANVNARILGNMPIPPPAARRAEAHSGAAERADGGRGQGESGGAGDSRRGGSTERGDYPRADALDRASARGFLEMSKIGRNLQNQSAPPPETGDGTRRQNHVCPNGGRRWQSRRNRSTAGNELRPSVKGLHAFQGWRRPVCQNHPVYAKWEACDSFGTAKRLRIRQYGVSCNPPFGRGDTRMDTPFRSSAVRSRRSRTTFQRRCGTTAGSKGILDQSRNPHPAHIGAEAHSHAHRQAARRVRKDSGGGARRVGRGRGDAVRFA